MRRRTAILAVLLVLAALLTAIGLRPKEVRNAEYRRPDGHYSIVVYRRPSWFAMPGQGSDAPGRVVLVDAAGRELQTMPIDLVQIVDSVEWGEKVVSARAVFEWRLPD